LQNNTTMVETFKLNLDKPIQIVSIVNAQTGPATENIQSDSYDKIESDSNTEKEMALKMQQYAFMQDIEMRKAEVEALCQALSSIIKELNKFFDEAVSIHREEIAALAVEIAGKILFERIEKGQYDIESIVKETLNNTPTHQDVVVHLNPEDAALCQKLQQDDKGCVFVGVQLVADPDIGRAQCRVETPKGIIKYIIDEHLEKISKALKQV
jgi:flagellar biosynthesis/type III secretory pathway protein FliH